MTGDPRAHCSRCARPLPHTAPEQQICDRFLADLAAADQFVAREEDRATAAVVAGTLAAIAQVRAKKARSR